nr:MAG TPA: hypothetical protein [Crassvirales sp.]
MGTNTGLGIGIGIPFKNNALGGDKPYFPPELKARMIGVWTNYGKKNTDTDRNIIKNKIPNAGGDLEILNAAYKLNSGFGEYSEDFTTWTKSSKITSVDSESFDFVTNVNWNLLYYKSNIGKDIPSFKVRIKLKGEGKVFYNYITSEGVYTNEAITSEEYVTPISYNTKYTGETPVNCGFSIGITSEESSGTITQIPNFEDAFVTDGVNDMIISQKTLQEMGVTKELTIVSMIHQISWRGSASVPLTNYIRPKTNEYVRNHVANIGKTGIYGYVVYDVNHSSAGNSHIINTILGDKNDYSIHITGNLSQGKFSVQGYINGEDNVVETSRVAHYWTFALLGKATEDDINLIIGYFNLDRTLKADIYCNIEKQGLTNENHAEFNDKLIDYSGNGRDIQMNNLAWKGGSGIAAKPFETIKDYTIVPDEARQKLTIYNEFSYKIKSNTPSYYWTVQSIIRDNTSYQVTIITDKDCYWINATSFINSERNKESIRKKYPVLANTPTQVIICGLDQFEYPEGIEPTSAVSYVNLEYAGEITITFIPSHKGGLLLDGVNDFGQFVGDLGLKDYTFIADRAYDRIVLEQAPFIASKSTNGQAPFLMEYLNSDNYVYPHSFGATTKTTNLNIQRQISYQSTYVYNGNSISKGTSVDTGDGLTIGNSGSTGAQYSPLCLWSLMLFPYSMSEFLIERQLKKHKLGTLYPDMVEFRPVIKSNASYDNIVFYYKNEKVENGTYLTVGSSIGMHIRLSSSPVNEIKSITVNGIPATFKYHDANNNIYQYDFNLTSKSPQKINITIDEYIRFEDIVQPYPSLFTLIDYDTEEVYSWGSKLKVGARFKGNVVNLLPNMYEWQGNVLYNGEVLDWGINPGVVAKEMVFSWNMPFKYLIDNNEPKCILSPRLLRIPNSSYKILGYIPDISGHGNNGVIHNSAYAEGSGVNEDGSYQLDGVDDFVTIPTIAGKQVLIKLNWQNKAIGNLIYDQRDNSSTTSFAIMPISINDTTNNKIAYQTKNANGITYIDGIRNEYIESYSLENIIHNITITNPDVSNKTVALGASNRTTADYFAKYALYDFMLFDNISTDDKIKELNEYVGIEAKVELPPYYWDTYGKTNSDADRDTIQQRGVAVGDYDLTNYNHAYEGMSGYNGYPVVFGANKTWKQMPTRNFTWNIDDNKLHITKALIAGNGLLFSYVKLNGSLLDVKEIPSFKIKVSGLEGNSKFGYRYLGTEDATEETLVYLGNGTHELAKSFAPTEALLDLTRNAWVGIFITPMVEGEVVFDCDITIEVLPEYENGLVYDGITDYSKNANIPALDDFTAIIKREWLKKQGCPLIKGSKVYEGGNGNALLLEWDKAYNFVFYKRTDIMEGEVPDNISFITPTNYNGNVITRGSEQDTNGICIAGDGNAGFANMIFYKLILYPKTIPLLQINFLKNLMERDEIIDLNNPIFIKNE